MIDKIVQRYAAVWNEPDPAARRAAVTELWTEDGVELLSDAEYRGHAELERRVADAHRRFVAEGGYEFVPAGDVAAHHDTAVFRVHMVPAGGGPIAWTGTIVLELDGGGRIRRDRQFAVPISPPPSPTRAVVDAFLARVAEGNPERIAELFAERVDWRLNWPDGEHPDTPWIRPRATRAEVADHFRELAAHNLPGEPPAEPPTVLVDGSDAVVLVELRQVARTTGVPYAARCALRLTVSDGLISRYHVYEDSLAVARAFGAE